MSFQAVLLAAGKGTRMKSERPKVLHEVLGRPMLEHALQAAVGAGADRAITVVGYGRETVRELLADHQLADDLEFAVQDQQLGTGHAVWAARKYLEADDAPEYTVITSGDVPLMSADALASFVRQVTESDRPFGVMTAEVPDPDGYGRIVRDPDGDVLGIVEHADASPDQKRISEINAGFYVARTEFLAEHLPELLAEDADNAQGEYYLTDLVDIACRETGTLGWTVDDHRLIKGVNTRADLAEATAFARDRINRAWMESGVTIIDPESTLVEPDVELARDVVLYPNVHLRGDTRVGEGTVIENGSVIRDCELAADVHVKPNCFLEDSSVDSGTNLGPFAHLRPGADIGKNCKVGNYVEVKKARLDDGVKAGHLAYIGDAHLGPATNVGAGTITCNYDGETKHRTTTGEGVFIGSNASLVAPVEIGDGAYIGAGSTITDDVPARALAVARGRQRNIEGWAEDDEGDE